MYYAGYSGYSWSAAVSDGSVRYLSFNNGGVYPQNATYRAHALPVRCLQE